MRRKALALLVSLALAMGLCVPAFADNTSSGVNDSTGSITIDNAVVGQEYSIYQVLVLESYDAAAGAYSYKANSAWESWLKTQTEYISFNESGYVTWVKDADVAAFAKAAQAYANVNGIPNQGSTTATSTTVKFENLNLGYYLVDSTLGTFCSLDTTNPNVTMKEKNGVPDNKKEVQEDSKVGSEADNHGWGDWNDADLGQAVNFRSTITAQAGAENYVFQDKMSPGLTYKGVTGVTLNGSTVDAANYEVKTEGLAEGYTFEVVFTQTFCDTLKADDKIVVSYTAEVNSNAVIGVPGNPNESRLAYGDISKPSHTPPSQTITYTWDLDVLKYANGDETKVLKDAQFVLLNSDSSKVATIVAGKLTGWVDVPSGAKEPSSWLASTVLITNENGKIEIDGLDSDTYYLHEVKAPAGYNILKADVKVEIKGATKAEGSEKLTYTTVVAKVNNQSGTEFPSTGGMGTTLFYAVGGLLIVGAIVLLVTRRRAGSED